MYIPVWLIVVGLSVAVVFWVRSRRLDERHRTAFQSWHDPESPQHPLAYSAACPVFSEHEARTANTSAIRASRKAAELESDCLGRADFKQSCANHEFTAAVRQSMLEVCEAIVDAEESWFRHSVMMHANLSAASGRVSREDALASAEARLKAIPSFGNDAERFREQWEANLVAHSGKDPEPFPYSTPWYRRTRSFYYSPRSVWWKTDRSAP